MCASLYQRNMELMLSVSSALLLLSMQQVSTQAHSMPAARAISQVFQILVKPGSLEAWTKSAMSWKGDLAVGPGVREDGVRQRGGPALELGEFERCGVD